MSSTSQPSAWLITTSDHTTTLAIRSQGNPIHPSSLEQFVSRVAGGLDRAANTVACRLFEWGPDEATKRILNALGEPDVELLRKLRGSTNEQTFPTLAKDCLWLMKYALPEETNETQVVAFKRIVMLTTRYPGLRHFFLRFEGLEGAKDVQIVALDLWKRTGACSPEWNFFGGLAAACISPGEDAEAVENTDPDKRGICSADGGLIDSLLGTLAYNGVYQVTGCVAIRYLGEVLKVSTFWLKDHYGSHKYFAGRLFQEIEKSLKDIGIGSSELSKSITEKISDIEGIDTLAHAALAGVQRWTIQISSQVLESDDWYDPFRRLITLLVTTNASKLVPNSSGRATEFAENTATSRWSTISEEESFTGGNTSGSVISGVGLASPAIEEDPGMDALHGGFATVGSIIRARSMRKSSISSIGTASPAVEQWRARHPYASGTEESGGNVFMPGFQRHQLYDAPVPRDSIYSNTTGGGGNDDISLQSQPRRGNQTIKFGAEDTRHFYPSPGLPEYPRFRSNTAESTDDEEEEDPLTASLHEPYPPGSDTEWRPRRPYVSGTDDESGGNVFMPGLQRHRLYDVPPRNSSLYEDEFFTSGNASGSVTPGVGSVSPPVKKDRGMGAGLLRMFKGEPNTLTLDRSSTIHGMGELRRGGLLRMFKGKPNTLKLDRRSTILLQATRRPPELEESYIAGFEDPGTDALRGGFGTVGSIIRARSMRKSRVGPASPDVEQWRARHPYASGTEELGGNVLMPGMQRHQLYDAPVPRDSIHSKTTGGDGNDDISLQSQPRRGNKTIKFGAEDIRHFYPSPGLPGNAHHDSVKKDLAQDADYPSAMGSVFSSQQTMSPVQTRPLPKANDPFEDPRFRSDTSGSTDDEAEEIPLTASLHNSYPPGGNTVEYREERSGLVGANDSVRLVSSRR